MTHEENKTCRQCGDAFVAHRSNQIYCTVRCRTRSARIRHNAAYNQWRMDHYYRQKANALREECDYALLPNTPTPRQRRPDHLPYRD